MKASEDMPDHKKLRIGDRVRLLRVPEADLRQREEQKHEDIESDLITANVIERIIREDPIVTIDEIDEYGRPWFSRQWKGTDGEIHYHSIALWDDDT
jgi:hypothetical protein